MTTRTYPAVARMDGELPVVIQGGIFPDTEEGQQKAVQHAWALFTRAKGRIPFCVVEVRAPYAAPYTRPEEG